MTGFDETVPADDDPASDGTARPDDQSAEAPQAERPRLGEGQYELDDEEKLGPQA